MEKEKIVKTEPVNQAITNNNSKSKKIKKSKNTLTLPLITNISNSLGREKSHNKIITNKNSQKRGIIKVNKKRMATARSSNQKKFKINKDLDLVYKLNMEIDVDHLFEEDIKLKKQKEKIDNNPDIKAKRLNIYKNIDKKDEKKMEIDSKEKEKYIEKEFKDELEKLEAIKKECNTINQQINQIRENIDEYKLEINVCNKYGDLLDKKFLEGMKEKEKEKEKNKYNNEIIEENNENENFDNEDDNNSINSNKNENNENEFYKKIQNKINLNKLMHIQK